MVSKMNDIIQKLEKHLNESLIYFLKIKGKDQLVDKLIDHCICIIEKNQKSWGGDRGQIAVSNTFIINTALNLLQKFCEYLKI